MRKQNNEEQIQNQDDQNVLTSQLKSDFHGWSKQAKDFMQERMREKLWRLEISDQIHAFVKGQNRTLRDSMNIKHSRKDAKLFSYMRRSFLEEDVFKYFYPFCIINVPLGTAIALRKQSWPTIVLSFLVSAEYVYFLFNFPVEAWHFHLRAMSDDKPYAQYTFPEKQKAEIYRRVNQQQREKYQKLRDDLLIKQKIE